MTALYMTDDRSVRCLSNTLERRAVQMNLSLLSAIWKLDILECWSLCTSVSGCGKARAGHVKGQAYSNRTDALVSGHLSAAEVLELICVGDAKLVSSTRVEHFDLIPR